jgi:LmbE family N-acetylglucosaminyl deacetylase
MKNFIHEIYVLAGTAFCNICLIGWRIRDRIAPPKTNAVLFVAHPDDDTLFFHTFIKEYKPYVCLMTTGWSLRRLPDFFKVMKYYGLRFRAYPMGTKDSRVNLLKRNAKAVLEIKDFDVVATHNTRGEYGHEEHERIHYVINDIVHESGKEKRFLCPVDREQIGDYPLPKSEILEKEMIFKKYYVTEVWVLDEDTEWVVNEKMMEEKINESVS